MSLLLLFVGSYLCSEFFNTFLVFFIDCFSACCSTYSLFSPSCPECAKVTVADIVFLVDGSSSIGIDNFKSAREFLKSVVTGLDIGPNKVRIGLAQYSDEPHQEFLLKDHMDKSSLLTALDEFPYRTGNTATGKAMNFLMTRYFTEDAGSRAKERVPQIAVVITDGDSGDDVVAPAKSLRQHGVIVFGIGVGQANLTELKAIANSPSEQYAYEIIPTVPTLRAIFEAEKLETTLTGANVADIVFIVDESGSIGTTNFKMVRAFLHSLVSGLEISRAKVRVGIVMYSDGASAQVFLDSFNDKSELLNFIKILPYRGGGTNTGAALNYARENVFIKVRGSRKDQGVQQVAVVITDGESQDDVSTAAADLRRAGVTVYAIGVKEANKAQLDQMASYPHNKHVFNVDNFEMLKGLELSLQKSLCHNIIRQAISVSTRRSGIKEGCIQTEEADIFFLIDHSGSIYPADFQDMKKFIIEFIHTFHISPEHVRIGVVKYADSPQLEFNLARYSDTKSLEKAIEDIKQIGGGTETGRALEYMGPLFDRSVVTPDHKVPEYLVVITDGKSSDEVKVPAEKLRAQGIIVYAIGVKSADRDELEEISGNPKRTFFVNNFDALRPIKDDIITDICSQDVCKDIPGDLLFLVDSSGSIYPNDYKTMKDFMKSVISRSMIGRDEVHVGVMQFSSIQQLEFPFNRYYSKDEILSAIDGMNQIGGGTDTGAAITALSRYFDPDQGGRPDMRQRLVVITDGESQDEVKAPAAALRAKGVVVYAIGVMEANTTQLLEISGSPERMYAERDFDALKDLESHVALELCDPERDCKKTEKADIIFLVDGSTSITLEKFRSMQKFMKSVVNETTVGKNLTRFGVILYSTNPQSIFTLKQYDSKRQVLKAIDALRSPFGDTYTGRALAYTLEYFNPDNGGRAALRVPQILMVITDGDATDRNSLVAPSVALRDSGISVFSIGVEGANKTQLEVMAGGDKSKVFYVDNFEALENLYKNITNVLCNTAKPVCEKQKADLVFLIDQSGSIAQQDYATMKKFTTDLINGFKVSKDLVRVGVAQFSSTFQDEFHLNKFDTEEDISKHILSMRQLGGGTNIGLALEHIKAYFEASQGGRRSEGISQNLVLITDGESQDEVEEAGDSLRGLGVEVFAIGIGDVHDLQLLQITGTPERLFNVQNFGSLEKIKQKVVNTICKSKPDPGTQEGCTIDVAMGFDITRRSGAPAETLVSGHNLLRTLLPEIAHYVTSKPGLCCVDPLRIRTSIGYRVVSQDGRTLYDTSFEGYSDDVVRKVSTFNLPQPTYFNTALLKSLGEKLKASGAGVKVLVIFSDGLDEDVMKLEQESELLRQSGVSALLTVALEGVRDPAQLQMVEFGRGFGYKLPLSIGMPSVGSALLKQIDTVSDRECCNVMCKCSGHEGVRGLRGPPGSKVTGTHTFHFKHNGKNVWGKVSEAIRRLSRSECPAFPTELVFGLDMSEDVTPVAFERQRSALLSLLEDVAITESNCPTGARVAVVGYSSYTKYLIRFQDYRRKNQLIDLVKNIALERTANRRQLGAAMRFVGQNVFKRVRSGLMMRKVAVFLSNGPSQDVNDIVTAMMEYRGLNIVPVVIALKNAPTISQAMETDDSGKSIFVVLFLVSSDPCTRLEECSFIQELVRPQQVDLDLVLVVDSSREVKADEYVGAQQLLGSVVEQLAVSSQPRRAGNQARVAVVQQSGTQVTKPEFGLQTYQNHDLMRTHLLQNMRQQGGSSALGHTLEFTLKEVLMKASLPRRRKAVLTVVGTQTAYEDRARLHYFSQKLKCEGVAMFVVTVGERFNRTQVEELASLPVDQHLIHLSGLKAEEQGYAQRFFRGMNSYPPPSLKRTCDQLKNQDGGQGPVIVNG
uniref:VWFA domain-containing protein n=1 Tax=Sparus aurata TaxID=8175 RepID=A0A671X2H5_SPAAU